MLKSDQASNLRKSTGSSIKKRISFNLVNENDYEITKSDQRRLNEKIAEMDERYAPMVEFNSGIYMEYVTCKEFNKKLLKKLKTLETNNKKMHKKIKRVAADETEDVYEEQLISIEARPNVSFVQSDEVKYMKEQQSTLRDQIDRLSRENKRYQYVNELEY